jgi:hypothetical protein
MRGASPFLAHPQHLLIVRADFPQPFPQAAAFTAQADAMHALPVACADQLMACSRLTRVCLAVGY